MIEDGFAFGEEALGEFGAGVIWAIQAEFDGLGGLLAAAALRGVIAAELDGAGGFAVAETANYQIGAFTFLGAGYLAPVYLDIPQRHKDIAATFAGQGALPNWVVTDQGTIAPASYLDLFSTVPIPIPPGIDPGSPTGTGVAVRAADQAGGQQTGESLQNFFKVETLLAVVKGDVVQPHGSAAHAMPRMAEGLDWFKINGIPVSRCGHLADCGHPTTGRDWFHLNG